MMMMMNYFVSVSRDSHRRQGPLHGSSSPMRFLEPASAQRGLNPMKQAYDLHVCWPDDRLY